MKNKKLRYTIAAGVLCAAWLAFAVWYAVTCNGSRLVTPTDVSGYVFQPGDLPMLSAGVLVAGFALYLFVLLVQAILKNNKTAQTSRTTRRLNPKLGFLGFAGLLGLLGFWTFRVDGSVYPFVFFIFFGFFGFFYEGKMSGTFMDERYTENVTRAQLGALKISFVLMVAAMIILSRGRFEYTGIAALILLSLAIGLMIFLSEYLLYRYDHDEQIAAEEEGER